MLKLDDLVCPICKGALELRAEGGATSLVCGGCPTIFQIDQGIPILLPKDLSPRKLNEDHIWAAHPVKGPEPIWKHLLLKEASIRFVENVVLPNFDFSQKKVLEVGAGACWASAMLKAYFPSSDYTSTDVSPNALVMGKKMCNLMETEVDRFICADIESLPFQDACFDIVVGLDFLHHVDSFRAVKEIDRVLSSKGLAIIYDGIVSPLLRPFFRKFWSQADRRSSKYNILEQTFTLKEIKQILGSAEFRTVKTIFVDDYKYWGLSLARFLLYKLIGPARRFILTPCIIICEKEAFHP